jgi:hypothetical protein
LLARIVGSISLATSLRRLELWLRLRATRRRALAALISLPTCRGRGRSGVRGSFILTSRRIASSRSVLLVLELLFEAIRAAGIEAGEILKLKVLVVHAGYYLGLEA